MRLLTTNSVNAVGPGQTATLSLSVATIYHKLVLNYKTNGALATVAEMIQDIEQVRIKIDGKNQRIFSAQELFTINSADGGHVKPGRLEIFFAEPWRRSAQGEDALAWGTRDVATFQVEIDVAAAAVSPSLSATVLVADPGQNRPMGGIIKWRQRNIPVSSAGLVNITDFDRLNAYYRIFNFSTDIDAIEIKIDQTTILEGSADELATYYNANGLLVPDGVTLIAFDSNKRISSALPMFNEQRQVGEFLIQYDMGAANSFNATSLIFGIRD